MLFYLNKNKIIFLTKPTISGLPIIIIHKYGKLNLGKNITFHSNAYSYHLHMNSPVKILIDRKGASINIGDNTRLNGCCIHAQDKISIGKNCLIAANT
jgi:acetyltransferase-like isoleucine patch superfamily enzyme